MRLFAWSPTVILGFGCLLAQGVRPQLSMPLRHALSETIPSRHGANVATDLKVGDAELDVLALDDYVLRSYAAPGEASAAYAYSVFVGYYASQTHGRTIHSPKNCLPGGGWETLSSESAHLNTSLGKVTVNRYLLHRGGSRALVLYWYQGRGRVEANEYRVKVNLLRDAALRGRSDEALVRIVVPVNGSEQAAFEAASEMAVKLVASVERALPE